MKRKTLLVVALSLVVMLVASGCSMFLTQDIAGKWSTPDGKVYEFGGGDFKVYQDGEVVDSGSYALDGSDVYLYAPDHDHSRETDNIVTRDGNIMRDRNGNVVYTLQM